ncbi:putative oxidoreductase C-terminal domain-containing protein [Albibacterium profundi]|uniref:Oxidoreductase C-terminal domain-containing protein n=1 Tax=Albibacterium profundi TaxID=3134906 RepID=A0ABV5CH59_9SPHI
MKKIYLILTVLFAAGCSGSSNNNSSDEMNSKVKLMTLAPGHFHAALVQKSMYADVDSTVHVYAPEGAELDAHMALIKQYNSDSDKPTAWKEAVYTGSDYFEKMLEEKAGNVVVLAGNNRDKINYIDQSIAAGFNVLADKPMAIDRAGFEVLKTAFDKAKEQDLLLYDIMTERYEITTMLQKEFSLLKDVYGEQEMGTEDNPAVTKESVHHFFKYVSGNPLTRPAWFFDVAQQGEGIVDVTTHLVDMIQWSLFPGEVIDYTRDINMLSAKRWPTTMSREQFQEATKQSDYPDYLHKDVVGDSLKVYSNGEMNYTLKGVHTKVSVIWNFQAPEGTGDTHYSIMRGSKTNLVIRQGADQGYKPALYIEPVEGKTDAYKEALLIGLKTIQEKFPGVELKEYDKGWEVLVPDEYKVGHEAHFAQVTEKYLEYLKKGNMPDWEVPNMIAKYYTTTEALELAKEGQ